jgi:hypothetical protein
MCTSVKSCLCCVVVSQEPTCCVVRPSQQSQIKHMCTQVQPVDFFHPRGQARSACTEMYLLCAGAVRDACGHWRREGAPQRTLYVDVSNDSLCNTIKPCSWGTCVVVHLYFVLCFNHRDSYVQVWEVMSLMSTQMYFERAWRHTIGSVSLPWLSPHGYDLHVYKHSTPAYIMHDCLH